jgi:hypothetical protein
LVTAGVSAIIGSFGSVVRVLGPVGGVWTGGRRAISFEGRLAGRFCGLVLISFGSGFVGGREAIVSLAPLAIDLLVFSAMG